MKMPHSTHYRIDWPRTIQQPLLAPEGDGGTGGASGDDAAAKAVADAAAKATADAAAAQTPEQKAAAEAAAKADQVSKDAAAKVAADAKAAEEAAKAGAPTKYELAIPKDGVVDAGDLSRIEELARENNLPNDVAQSMVETTNAYLAQQAETWSKELEGDKVYGGDKLPETEKHTSAFLDKFAPKGTVYGDGLRKMLSRGVGNNLYVVAAMANVGRAMQEDTIVGGAPAGGDTKKKSIPELLYPNSPEFKKP